MLKKIWKFSVDTGLIVNRIENVPIGHEWLTVGVQDGIIQAWALVDPNADTEPAFLLLIPTGGAIPTEAKLQLGACLGRVELNDRKYVLHVFIGHEKDGNEILADRN